MEITEVFDNLKIKREKEIIKTLHYIRRERDRESDGALHTMNPFKS